MSSALLLRRQQARLPRVEHVPGQEFPGQELVRALERASAHDLLDPWRRAACLAVVARTYCPAGAVGSPSESISRFAQPKKAAA
jgi:hypothetical protein